MTRTDSWVMCAEDDGLYCSNTQVFLLFIENKRILGWCEFGRSHELLQSRYVRMGFSGLSFEWTIDNKVNKSFPRTAILILKIIVVWFASLLFICLSGNLIRSFILSFEARWRLLVRHVAGCIAGCFSFIWWNICGNLRSLCQTKRGVSFKIFSLKSI